MHVLRPPSLAVHVSRVFQADIDRLYKYALAAPIRDPSKPRSRILGVIIATVATDPTMGLPQLHDEERNAVLVGRKDDDASVHLILVHPAIHPREEPVAIDNRRLRTILERQLTANELDLPASAPNLDVNRDVDSTYRDPVASRYSKYDGRWLAGFAPVGNTEFAIIVQQRYDEAIPPDDSVLWSGAAVLLGALFTVSTGWFFLQSFRHPRD